MEAMAKTESKLSKLMLRSGLLLVVLAIGACNSDADSGTGGPAYDRVVDEKPIQVSAKRQVLTLSTGAQDEQAVILKVPAGAVPTGVTVSVRSVTGLPKKTRAPVGDIAIEILPQSVVFEIPVRARIRVPAPALTKRYAAVQAPSAASSDFVRKANGRRVGLGTDSQPDSELWEIDIMSGGVWGVGEHEVALGAVLADGVAVTDEVEIEMVDEEQQVLVGPVKERRLLVVPAEADADVSAAVAVSSANRDHRLFRFDRIDSAEVAVPYAQPEPLVVVQQARRRAPVVVQTVSPAPGRGGRNVPIPATVLRVSRPAVPEPLPAPVRPRVVVVQPVPTPRRMLTPVNAGEDAGPWMAAGMVRAARAGVSVPGLTEPHRFVEYDLPAEASGYWGIAEMADDQPAEGLLVATPTTASFGTVVVGASGEPVVVSVRNDGNAPVAMLGAAITGPGANAFSLVANGCALATLTNGSAPCAISIAFTPTTAGDHQAELLIASGRDTVTIALSGLARAAAGLALTPQGPDFGSVITGMTGPELVLTLRNPGGFATGAPTVRTGGTHAAEFQIARNGCQAALAPGDTCTLGLRFSPTARGMRSGTLIVDAVPGGTTQVALSGRGQAPGDLRIDPSPHAFGNVLVGTGGTIQDFTVTNPGDVATGPIQVGIGGANPAAFAITTDGCATSLAPAATCVVRVVFRPTAAGAASALLQLSANPGGSTAAALTGTGQAVAALALSQTAVDLGGVVVGQTGTPSAVTVTNSGGVATGVLGLTLGGGAAGDFRLTDDGCSGNSLAAGASCNVSVTVVPSSTGARAATLSLVATPGGNTSIALAATGLEVANLVFSPSNANFGSVQVSTMGSLTRFTVNNGGAQPSGVPAIGIIGVHAADFQIASMTCQTAIAGPGTCTIDVRFTPGGPGARSASLQLTATPGGTANAGLSGTGLSPALLAANPGAATFGSVVSGGTSGATTITLTNTGDMASGLVTFAFGGANMSEFTVLSNACGASLPGGDSCQIGVAFSPTGTGTRSATFTISAIPGGMVDVPLSGTSLAPSALGAAPGSIGFGDRQVGTPSTANLVTVSNNGGVVTGSITATLTGPQSSDFATTTTCATLAPNADCNISVTFTPGAAGPRSATLTIAATPGGTIQIPISGAGLAPALLAVTPTTHGFGPQTAGMTTAPIAFTISNTGGVSAGAITTVLSGNDPGDFAVSSTCTTLAGGANCAINVTFTPGTIGARSATLTVQSAAGGSVPIALSGTGLAPAALAVAPTAHNFGSITVGGTTFPTGLTISNTGGATTGTISVMVIGPTAADFAATTACTTLTGGDTCTVNVTFTPAAAGSRNADLLVSASPGGTRVVSLSGIGLDSATLAVNPATLVFAGQLVNTTSAGSATTVSNTGGSPTGTVTAVLSGTNPTSFAVTTACTTIAGGDNCAVNVTFTPTASGSHTAILTIQASPGGMALVNLSGTGLTPANLVVSPSPHNFGTVTVGQSSTTENFTVTNVGGIASGAITSALFGPDAADFSIAGNSCGAGLASNTSCTIGIRLSPPANSAAVAKIAGLNVSASPGGMPTATLNGTVRDIAVYVSTIGSDSNPGSRTQPKLSIQSAVSTAAAGGYTQVRVTTGTFSRTNGGISASATAGVDIANALTLSGGWAVDFSSVIGTSTLNAENQADHVIRISASNVSLRDLIIDSGYADGTVFEAYGGGILISGSGQITDIEILRVVVRDCYSYRNGAGLYAYNTRRLTIAESQFLSNATDPTFGAGGGITLDSVFDANVRDTVIDGNSGGPSGMSARFSSNLTIERMTFFNNAATSVSGLWLYGGTGFTIVRDSSFEELGTALALGADTTISNLTIQNNVFTGSPGTAILDNVADLQGYTITNNRFNLATVQTLYQRNTNSASTPPTAGGLGILNTPAHANHGAEVASGNSAL